MTNQKKVIAIDSRPLARGSGGIQRYLRKILPYLIESGLYDVVLYSDHPITGLDKACKKSTRIRQVNLGRLSSIGWYFKVPFWLRADAVELYWSPRHHLPLLVPKQCKTIITVHDFVYKTAPETMPVPQFFSEKLQMPSSIRKSDKIICISHTTSKQLDEFFPDNADKSTVILHGNDDLTPAIKSDKKCSRDYFLAVGTLEPRKNYVRLIEAFSRYASEGGNKDLVIVGKRGWDFESIYAALELSKYKQRIKIENEINDNELLNLYQCAAGFISNSVDEGYGLPAQEAAAIGVPLLLSNIEVYRELYPFAALWTNPQSIEETATRMSELEDINATGRRVPVINKRTWRDCSRELLRGIQSLHT